MKASSFFIDKSTPTGVQLFQGDKNMKIEIYHGSDHIIKKPSFGYGKPYNDYGKGFYCTYSQDMAKEWGVRIDRNGYSNKYKIETDSLKILNLNDGSYSILTWLAILLENREFEIPSPLALEAKEYLLNNFLINYKEYDIIIGYRADDSYFSFAQDFLNGTISYRQLTNAMYLGKLGEQFVIKSEKAFEALSFEGYEIADKSIWYSKKETRNKNARRDYLDRERNKRQRGDLYIIDIIDEEMRIDDHRLR